MKIIIHPPIEIDVDGDKCGKDCQYVEETYTCIRDSWHNQYYWLCNNPFWGQKLKYRTALGYKASAGETSIVGGDYAYRCQACLDAEKEEAV